MSSQKNNFDLDRRKEDRRKGDRRKTNKDICNKIEEMNEMIYNISKDIHEINKKFQNR
jgi:hypothetical protein